MSERKEKTKALQPCRYCGGQCKESEGDICGYCRNKLPTVRKLIAIGNMIRRRAEEEKKIQQESIIKKEQEQHGQQKI